MEKGLELFKIGVYEEAKKCFRNGGDSRGPCSHYRAPLYILCTESPDEYAGRCMNNLTAHGCAM
jgi:hypothetical protein